MTDERGRAGGMLIRAGRFDFSPLRIAAIYAVLGGVWISWSDSVVEALVRDHESITRLQTAKGWFFVIASALLIYALVSRRVRALRDAERKEHEARATVEAVIDASPYAMFTLDRQGRVESWNVAAERLFGRTTGHVVGRRLFTEELSLGAREVDDRLRTLFDDAVRGTVGTGFATLTAPEHAASEGERREIRFVVGPVGDRDGVRGAVVFARDVTEERASARERARLVAVLEATTDLVAVFTPTGEPHYVNPAGRRLLGIGADAPIERFNSRDFLIPESRTEAEEIRDAVATRGTYEVERNLRRIDGSTIPVSQVLIAHRGPDGGVEFISTIVRDLSERVKQEEALRQSQKMEAVGRLAGGVAHDFNNLLTVILGCGELLRTSLPAEGGREDANEIVLAAERGARLTRQLLAYSRQQVLAVDSVDVNGVVRSLLAMLRRLVGDDIALVEVLDPDTPHVRVDRGQFEQVIVNLVVNARDAMPKGGTVTIRSWREGLEGGVAAGLEVRDTGVGMDEATQSRVFEPFFTTKMLGGGTGLGLATVYGIVKQSGGEITVESAPGAGAAFRIVIPADAGDVSRGDGSTSPTPSGGTPAIGRRKRVLVVEDEENVRRTAARMLRDDGWTVEEASSVQEALAIVRERGNVPVVLTDVEMPNESGRDLALQLASLPVPPRVVFMSGYTTDALLLRGTLPANASFVSKPFTSVTLRKALQEALHAE